MQSGHSEIIVEKEEAIVKEEMAMSQATAQMSVSTTPNKRSKLTTKAHLGMSNNILVTHELFPTWE